MKSYERLLELAEELSTAEHEAQQAILDMENLLWEIREIIEDDWFEPDESLRDEFEKLAGEIECVDLNADASGVVQRIELLCGALTG